MRPGFVSVTVPALLFAAAASAATIVVAPGSPIQPAIDAAAPGDTVRLLVGDYTDGGLVIDKPLKLRGAGSTKPGPGGTTAIAQACGVAVVPMLRITADDVSIRGVAFVSATAGGVEVAGRTRVRIQDVLVNAANCASASAPAFDVHDSSRVVMVKLWGVGRGPAGVRIAGTPVKGRVVLRNSIAGLYDVGVLLESNGDRAIKVTSSYVNNNQRGIVLTDTDGAAITRNHEVYFNAITGIEVDAASTGNRIVGNRIQGSPTDILDAGSGNCWRSNTFTTGTDPGCP